MLYLGYVGFSVPFAFALAALIMKYPGEKWIHITRRWTMVTWLFLTCGIFLGAHWAYAVLGWGGYWGWDPVENASLLPWLTGTAFLHSVMMQEKRGMMKVWNVWLIFTTFMLSIFGTLLTRSGIVQSVHAFAQSGIGQWFAGDFGWSGTPWHSIPYAYPGFIEIIFGRVPLVLSEEPRRTCNQKTNWSLWSHANPASSSITLCCWQRALPYCAEPLPDTFRLGPRIQDHRGRAFLQ